MPASRLFVAPVTALALLAAPAAAQAADTFVDDDMGDDANPCTMAQPCLTIQHGLDVAGAGETTRVDGGNYGESITLSGGRSLVEQEFNTADGDSQAIIDGIGAAAITVPVLATGGTIQGFNVRSTATALSLAGPVTAVTGNTFDSTADNSTGVGVNNAAAGGSTIGPSNTFTDNGVDGERRFGVSVAAGSPTITGNVFSDLSDPIFGPGSGTISGNTITGTHLVQGFGVGGVAITVVGATPTIVANQIHTPDASIGAIGISVQELGPSTGATLRRNRIFDHDTGVSVFGTTAAVTLNSDVIKGTSAAGLAATDSAPPGSDGDVGAANVTFAGNLLDITLNDAALTLDSSIVEDPIGANGTSTCLINTSRGPTTTPGGNGCAEFQTTADPMFAPDGYHLLAGSPMIDMGATDLPLPPDDLDVDGQPRAVGGTFTCAGQSAARLDIGADEFQPTAPSCPALVPPVTPTSTPAPPPAKRKKCKRKKRGASAAKKCRKKR